MHLNGAENAPKCRNSSSQYLGVGLPGRPGLPVRVLVMTAMRPATGSATVRHLSTVAPPAAETARRQDVASCVTAQVEFCSTSLVHVSPYVRQLLGNSVFWAAAVLFLGTAGGRMTSRRQCPRGGGACEIPPPLQEILLSV